jgi:hypothetical protein
LAVAGVVGQFMLLASAGLAAQVLNGKPLPRGDSRGGDLIGAVGGNSQAWPAIAACPHGPAMTLVE